MEKIIGLFSNNLGAIAFWQVKEKSDRIDY
jgi:hypothetical protein